MKVLIQETTTKLFLSGSGKWVSNPELALDLGNFDAACKFADQFIQHNIDIVYHDTRLGVTTSLRPGERGRRPRTEK